MFPLLAGNRFFHCRRHLHNTHPRLSKNKGNRPAAGRRYFSRPAKLVSILPAVGFLQEKLASINAPAGCNACSAALLSLILSNFVSYACKFRPLSSPVSRNRTPGRSDGDSHPYCSGCGHIISESAENEMNKFPFTTLFALCLVCCCGSAKPAHHRSRTRNLCAFRQASTA